MSEEDICAIEHLILCTIRHSLVLECSFGDGWADNGDVKKLFERHAIAPISLVTSNLREIFLDLDLAILGTSSHEYDEYASKVRQEYCHYSSDEYRSGRKAVLKGFLARERLYFTDYFHQLYEVQARLNLERDIDSLR